MIINSSGIICATRQHGETAVIVRVLTPEHGLMAGYVRGGRSRHLRPVLQPGNAANCVFSARLPGQLASLTLEPVHSLGALMAEPLAAAGIEWVTALVASSLPENHTYSALFDGLQAMLAAIEGAPSARGWATALARFEALLLATLGYGAGRTLPSDDSWEAAIAALNVNAAQLERHIFADRHRDVLAARERLVARLNRAVA